MRKMAVVLFAFAVMTSGCSEPGTGGTGGAGGTAGSGGSGGSGGDPPPPPPPAVDQTCRDWCANEPAGFSCHQGPPESVQDCYEGCLVDYQSEAERQCADEWIAIKDCQVDQECEDLFGECDSIEASLDGCHQLADNREYCETNCPELDTVECQQDTAECQMLVSAKDYCATNCPTQDRQECVEQYLATGSCGCVNQFPPIQPDLPIPPRFPADGQAAVAPGDTVEAEVTVNGATRQVLVELSNVRVSQEVIATQQLGTAGNETIPMMFLTDQATRGRFYMRVTLCGIDCNERAVIFDMNPDVESNYERTVIESGETVQIDRACFGFGAVPGVGSGTVVIQ